MTPYGDIHLGFNCFRKWPDSYSPPSHSLDQCRLIAIWNLTNSIQQHSDRNSHFFIEENVLKNVACKMTAIWLRPYNVKCSPVSLEVGLLISLNFISFILLMMPKIFLMNNNVKSIMMCNMLPKIYTGFAAIQTITKRAKYIKYQLHMIWKLDKTFMYYNCLDILQPI